ncbi:MAG TPA: murein biosynthesis integral membrane protein MurJ [Vicinamibacterales bacterium]
MDVPAATTSTDRHAGLAKAASAPPADAPSPGATHLARSAGVVGLATMFSRVLGLVRDLALAHVFGASHETDAYTVAFRIPNLLRDLFAEGAMSSAFVPTFTRVLTLDGKAAAWRLGNLVITALLLVTGAFVLLGMVFTWPLVTFAAEKYSEVPGKLELAVSLARVMFPFLTLIAIAAGFMGMLNSLRRFFVPAFSPAMFNIGTLATMAVLIPVFRAYGIRPIFAVAIGTLVGGVGQVVVQWPILRREGFRYRPLIDFRDPGLREVLTLMGPGTMALAAVQINVLINTMLATSQGEGAVSWLNFAFRVMYLPIGLFGLSIATAAIPSLSRDAARNDRDRMRGTVSSALRMMLMLNVPATLGLMVLSTPIVALLFEHGSFTAEATAGTAAALFFYAPGLIGYSAIKLAVPTFYALHDSRTPVVVGAVSVVFNIALNLILVRVLGFRGLAVGTAASALFNAFLLMWLLRRKLGGIDGRRVGLALAKVTLAATFMALVAWSCHGWLEGAMPGSSLSVKLFRVGASIGLGMGGLALAARTLRIAEFNEAFRALTARFFPPGTA